jgi:uncharacterized membrane protein YeaQ/YmgE (transglycosylase-associated protein family)
VSVVLIAIAAVVLLFIVAWLVVGLVLKLLWWAIVGVIIGVIARMILPGRQAIGVLATAASGIGAAFIGGVLGHIFGLGSILQFVLAVIAAVVIVAIVGSSQPARA